MTVAGQAKVEYILLVVFIAIAGISAVTLYGRRIAGLFQGSTVRLDGDEVAVIPTNAPAGNLPGAVGPPQEGGATTPATGGGTVPLTGGPNPLNPTPVPSGTAPQAEPDGYAGGHPGLVPAGYGEDDDEPQIEPAVQDGDDPPEVLPASFKLTMPTVTKLWREMVTKFNRVAEAFRKLDPRKNCNAGDYHRLLRLARDAGAAYYAASVLNALSRQGKFQLSPQDSRSLQTVLGYVGASQQMALLRQCFALAATKAGRDLTAFHREIVVGWVDAAIRYAMGELPFYAAPAWLTPNSGISTWDWPDIWRSLPEATKRLVRRGTPKLNDRQRIEQLRKVLAPNVPMKSFRKKMGLPA